MAKSNTSPATLKLARRYLTHGIKHGTDKVSAVRALAAWSDPEGHQLTRADVFALLHESGLQVADNTISRQFHRVRRGELEILY